MSEQSALENRIQDIHDRLHYQERRLESLEQERQDFRAATKEMRAAREELSSALRELATLTERLDGSRSHAGQQIEGLWGRHHALEERVRGIEQKIPLVIKTSERNENHADKISDSTRRMWAAFIGGTASGVAVMLAGYFLLGSGAGA